MVSTIVRLWPRTWLARVLRRQPASSGGSRTDLLKRRVF
jgi:hypothetical protein